MAVGVFGLIACGGDSTGAATSTNDNILWSLAFQWPAVNLALTAPYDTIQMTAIPRTANGTIATDTNVVHYTTPDSAISVSATGLVTARYPSAGARLIARFTMGGITLTDTALVQVADVPLPAPLATLSIQPQTDGLESARTSLGTSTNIPFFATIATGDPATSTICDGIYGCTYPLLVYYASSDPSIAAIDQSGTFNPHRTGRVTFTVSTVAYGVRKVDSLPFAIGYIATANSLIRVDSTQRPLRLILDQPIRTMPYGIGMTLAILNNTTTEKVIVTVPGLSHGVHYITDTTNTYNNPPATQTVDTLSTIDAPGFLSLVYVQFDSAGTYMLQYRGLTSGTTLSETFKIKPDP